MPIPKVGPKEKEADYISRCMAAIGGEYDDNKQAVAICASTFQQAKKLEAEHAAAVNPAPNAVLRAGDQVVAGRYAEELKPEDLPPHLRRRDLRPDNDDLTLQSP